MKFSILNQIFGNNETYPIVVIQYERDGFSVGREDQFHWALIVITDEKEKSGPCWQALDRHYSDGRGVIWELYDGKVVHPERTTKCLGGVKVGSVKKSELKSLKEILGALQPAPKFHEWNCRDWVVEAILCLQVNGWISEGVIPSQDFLLTGLREASAQTANTAPDSMTKRKSLVIVDHT
ncbi:hypothetical protein DFH05DRAFT_1055928 [Lentinula detonsa]|uniref:Uncharacterized protein n=1 Tax=Lentinula detonsa TaxID=2804962 RepID=A0A9W8P309_9AGAR|nr:hypothetical protein DFH05DRAFT_1055928 [Lentinula detonsa]